MLTWTELPVLLMDKVLHEFDFRDIPRLRPVCKSREAACKEFRGTAIVYVRGRQEMEDFCAALPDLSTVALTKSSAAFQLQPLSACSGLSDLSLYDTLGSE